MSSEELVDGAHIGACKCDSRAPPHHLIIVHLTTVQRNAQKGRVRTNVEVGERAGERGRKTRGPHGPDWLFRVLFFRVHWGRCDLRALEFGKQHLRK